MAVIRDPYFGGSKYPIFKVSVSKNRTMNGLWDQESENSHTGYLDRLGILWLRL